MKKKLLLVAIGISTLLVISCAKRDRGKISFGDDNGGSSIGTDRLKFPQKAAMEEVLKRIEKYDFKTVANRIVLQNKIASDLSSIDAQEFEKTKELAGRIEIPNSIDGVSLGVVDSNPRLPQALDKEVDLDRNNSYNLTSDSSRTRGNGRGSVNGKTSRPQASAARRGPKVSIKLHLNIKSEDKVHSIQFSGRFFLERKAGQLQSTNKAYSASALCILTCDAVLVMVSEKDKASAPVLLTIRKDDPKKRLLSKTNLNSKNNEDSNEENSENESTPERDDSSSKVFKLFLDRLSRGVITSVSNVLLTQSLVILDVASPEFTLLSRASIRGAGDDMSVDTAIDITQPKIDLEFKGEISNDEESLPTLYLRPVIDDVEEDYLVKVQY